MTTELNYLGWTLVLAIIQVLLAASFKTQQYGVKWNTGPRDEEQPPLKPLAGRLQRAQNNLFETLPLFAAAILIAHVAGREGTLTLWGSALYFWARVVYVALYAAGLRYVRSLIWVVSLVGLILILLAILSPA